jgi:hypothetical protein
LNTLRKYKNVIATFFVAVTIFFSGLLQSNLTNARRLDNSEGAYISSTVLPDDGIQQSSFEKGQSLPLPVKDLLFDEGGLSQSQIKLAILSSVNINIHKSAPASLSEKWIRNRMLRI